MREGYAWMAHFADGWDWLDETIYSSIDEVYNAVDKRKMPHDGICIDKVKEVSQGDFNIIQNITIGEKIIFWDDDIGWIT